MPSHLLLHDLDADGFTGDIVKFVLAIKLRFRFLQPAETDRQGVPPKLINLMGANRPTRPLPRNAIQISSANPAPACLYESR